MKELFILIMAVFVCFNLSLIVFKVVEYLKLTEEIEFDMYNLMALKSNLEDFILSKLGFALIWGILLVIIIIYF